MEGSDFQSRSLEGDFALRHRMRRETWMQKMKRRIGPPSSWKDKLPKNKQEWKALIWKTAKWGTGILALYFIFLWVTLPDISDPESLFASESTVITDRNGTELYRVFQEQDRTFIDGSQIPDHMRHAMIAIEDERFYDRGCLDIRSLLRVVFRFGQAGGASTITRQLARNALNLTQENILNRKLKELILGCQLEGKYAKDDLLDLYLNWIPFGSNAYGIEQASQQYFSSSASGLTLAQSAVLAALPQRPSYFSPYGNHVRTEVDPEVIEGIVSGDITKASQIDDNQITIGLLGADVGTGSTTVYMGGRTDQVLKNMQDQKFITEEERLAALEQLKTITFQPSRDDIRAPYFVLWVREQLEEIFKGTEEATLLERGGYQVMTTLNWEMQKAAEEVIIKHREDMANRFGAKNMALMSVDPTTREVLAYVGNVAYGDDADGVKIDMVHAPRQPGSSFKPFIYTAAFQRGYGPATVLHDVPTKIGEDTPQNYDGTFWGVTTIRKALAGSRNIPAAKAFFLAGGEDSILNLVSALGAPTPKVRRAELKAERGEFEYGWPIALGAAETPLMEMVHAYSSLADGGTYKPLVSILQVKDREGNIIYKAEPSVSEEIIDPRIAYQITSILSDEAARPTDYWRSQLTVPGYQTAAKTGTSNKCLEFTEAGGCKVRKPDNTWVMGYTPSLVTGMWAGNADSSPLFDRADGLTSVSPLWKEYMTRAHRLIKSPKTTFTMPSGLVQVQISTLSGELPTECTPVEYRQSDIFLAEKAPTEADPACVQLEVDKVTGLLASDSCPEEAREMRSFIVPRSILADRFPQWNQAVIDWAQKQVAGTGALSVFAIAPTEECNLSDTPGRMVKPELNVSFPTNGATVSYPSFKPLFDYEVGSSAREVRVSVDGKLVKTFTTPPFEGSVSVPKTISREGTHTIEIVLVDEYYNEVKETISVRFGEDSNSPFLTLSAPVEGTIVKKGEEISMRANAEDGQGGIKYVQFYFDGVLLSNKPKSPYELTYTIDKEPGTYTIKAVATDFSDNEAEDEVEITVVAE